MDLCGTNWHWDRLWFLSTIHIINLSYSFSVIITKGPFQTALPRLTTFLYICKSISVHQILTLGLTNWHWDMLWLLPTIHIINLSYSFSVVITKGPFQTALPRLTAFLYIFKSVSVHQILTLGLHCSQTRHCAVR